MVVTKGNTGYFIEKGYVEECTIQMVHDHSYTVKSSYYTFDIAKADVYNSVEAAKRVLNQKKEEHLHYYLKQMESKEDFIMFCIQNTFHNAYDPDNGSQELITALQQTYKKHFGKELT